jgi:hypothetical protein
MPESPKADLHRYLQAARDALLWKLDGLSEYDVRHNAGAGAAGRDGRLLSSAPCGECHRGSRHLVSIR